MSAKWIWIVVAIVVILAGLWWAGVFGPSTQGVSQGAAVVTGVTQTDPALSNVNLMTSLAGVDGQLAAINKSISLLGTAPTKAQISSVATSINPVVTAMSRLASMLHSRGTNTKTTGGSVPSQQVFNDLTIQLSNASSFAATANKNVMATSSKPSTLSTSAAQLETAQNDLTAARADIQSIFQTLAIH